MEHRYIALVDWIFGPNWVSFEQYFYGNWDNVPIIFIFDLLSKIIPSYVLQYIFIALLFVLGISSMRFCLRRFTTTWRIQLIGSLLFVLTPWVYDRLFFGQVWVVAAYMFLPVVIGLAWDLISRRLDIGFLLSLIFSLFFLGMLNARYFPIGLIVIASFFAYRLYKDRSLQVIYYGLATLIGSLFLSLYWIVPLLQSDIIASLHDVAQMQFFTPTGSFLSLFVDTLALHNSWMNYKTHALVSVDSIVALSWIFPMVYSLLVVGALAVWRFGAQYILFFWALFAWFFSLNLATPFLSHVNLWIFTSIPFFSAYREPGKRMALVAIFYIICIVVLLTQTLRHRTTWIVRGLVAIVLWASIYLFVFVPWEKNRTIQYPADWYTAKQQYGAILNSPSTIVFPWHWYMGCDFSDRRIIQNPAKTFFGLAIVYGDNMEWWGVYSYSTKPLSVDLAKVLSDKRSPIDMDILLSTLRSHGIEHIAYLSTCASAPRYTWIVDLTEPVYSGSHIQILAVPAF